MGVGLLSPQEIHETLEVLNLALSNHRKWFDRMHTSMIFGEEFPQDIANENAHRCCQFGQWYYGNLAGVFEEYDEFVLLESAHRAMHDHARELSLQFLSNQSPSKNSYKNFLSFQREVIRLLQALHDKLLDLGHGFDFLTGLSNRAFVTSFLDSMFHKARRYNNSYCVAMCDADKFKNINDTYGHDVGDEVLKAFAHELRGRFRKSDCIGRIGGEEFLILLPEISLPNAYELMEKFRVGMQNRTIEVGEHRLQVTCSVGLSMFNTEDEDSWQAVKRADFALYRAKESGRNQTQISD